MTKIKLEEINLEEILDEQRNLIKGIREDLSEFNKRMFVLNNEIEQLKKKI